MSRITTPIARAHRGSIPIREPIRTLTNRFLPPKCKTACLRQLLAGIGLQQDTDVVKGCDGVSQVPFRPIGGASMPYRSRREFLKTGLAAGALAVSASLPLRAGRQTATDWVTLGKSGVKVTRLAFGTGSFSGQVQRDLGQDGFTHLVRYAYDRGIRFFETAESYGEMLKMLGIALKGIPRESYQLMSKMTTRDGMTPQQKFDEL